MEQIKEQQNDINNFYNRIVNIKNNIKNQIENLPQNKNIEQLSDTAFIISSSNLNKDCVLSARFYDFKYQYKKIGILLNSISPHSIYNRLQTAINEKSIMVNNERIKLHPDVIKHLETLL